MPDTQSAVIRVVPVITTDIYVAGDAVGGLLTFENALIQAQQQTGVILSVTIQDNDKENAPLELVLFSETFTATADHDVFDPSDADLANCLGKIAIAAGDYTSFNDNSIATVSNAGLVVRSTHATNQKGDGHLYGQLITSGTPTYTAVTDLAVTIGVLQD